LTEAPVQQATRTAINIETRDGVCPASLFRPAGAGPWPGVIMFMDGVGIRPALHEMATRIADAGYVVLLPDLFYRAGPYEAPDPKRLFSDLEFRKNWFATHASEVTFPNVMSDVSAFLDLLARDAGVTQPKVGTTGYCMGGKFALAAAGHYPDRIAAAASFHGANLATDAPDSPHLLAPRMKAKVYVAGAVEDASFTDDMKRRLDDALTAAGVDHIVETYAGLRHGWVPADLPVHDPEGAERHFRALLSLYDATLKDRPG
jgi:carboxymethylenebutenolidase